MILGHHILGGIEIIKLEFSFMLKPGVKPRMSWSTAWDIPPLLGHPTLPGRPNPCWDIPPLPEHPTFARTSQPYWDLTMNRLQTRSFSHHTALRVLPPGWVEVES